MDFNSLDTRKLFIKINTSDIMKKATFAAGCFWHVEEVFTKTPGVKSTQVGYTGGNLENPTYEQVCTDRTGHAKQLRSNMNLKKFHIKNYSKFSLRIITQLHLTDRVQTLEYNIALLSFVMILSKKN